MTERFRPSVTVAALIEHEGRFLMVEEHTPEGLRLNNPAGHLEQGETPLQAVVREVLEETACAFTPDALLGVYLSRFVRSATGEDITYLRLAFLGRVGPPQAGRALDAGIVRTCWMDAPALRQSAHRHRSPLVLRCVEDYLRGCRYPLEVLQADACVHQPWALGPT